MRVELMRYTPEPERAVAAAARLCYSDRMPPDVAAGMSDAEVKRLILMLLDMGHTSPLEHASFTFGIFGVSRSLSHQLVRHRIASYSQRSQRYVSEEGFGFVVPPSIKRDPSSVAAFEAAMEAARSAYKRLVQMGVPREDARYVLPNACETALVATFNARSLLNFFALRCCRRAQWEIRALAYRMLKEVRRVAPTLFSRAGASCIVEGVCREGRFSCGLVNKLRRGRQESAQVTSSARTR